MTFRLAGLFFSVLTLLEPVCAEHYSPGPQRSPSIDSLPDWLSSRVSSDRNLRIALVGCIPERAHPRLQSGANFRLSLPDQCCVPSNEADTRLALWLRSAWPRVRLSVVPVSAGQQADGGIAKAVTWAVAQKPDVMHISYELFRPPCDERRELTEAIAAAWANACLPFTVGPEGDRFVPPGILRIARFSVAAGERSGDPDMEVVDGLIHADSDDSLVGNGQAELTRRNRAIGYLSLVIAGLQAEGPLAHLERASRLMLACRPRPSSEQSHNVLHLLEIDASYTARPAEDVRFGANALAWNSLASDIQYFRQKELSKAQNEEELRFLTLARDSAKVRHLAAMAHLAQITPLLVTPGKRIVMVFRSLHDDATQGDPYPLLRTLASREDSHLPFYTVSPDARVIVNP
jgi:hypothetical protein